MANVVFRLTGNYIMNNLIGLLRNVIVVFSFEKTFKHDIFKTARTDFSWCNFQTNQMVNLSIILRQSIKADFHVQKRICRNRWTPEILLNYLYFGHIVFIMLNWLRACIEHILQDILSSRRDIFYIEVSHLVSLFWCTTH